MQKRDAIAIVGIGCRFPGAANSPDSYWSLLRGGVDAISEIPPDRWSIPAFYDPVPGKPGKTYSRWGGFIQGIDRFDPTAFGISPREAELMDPQQRLLLETSWEALEDAGLVPEQSGSRTGVFVGISHTDYQSLQSAGGDRSGIEMHSPTGQAHSIAANRISYIFNFLGPSVAVDTACSSSLIAVHFACRSLWEGECEMALTGGVNILLSPDTFIGFSRASMLSPDGRCKAFDAAANGFVRAEGAGIIVLKKYAQAVADGDRIYALILGSAANQDGHTSGLMVPSESSQKALVEQACTDAGVHPGEVAYVEAHGTGTELGDPIEARALGMALRKGRPQDRPCLLGSAKTNIGHLEASSGVAGLIKAALVAYHREVPPNLHFRKPNPNIPFEELGLRVVSKAQPLPAAPEPVLTGVNSFGFGGANAHVILSSVPSKKASRTRLRRKADSALPESAPLLPLVLSARSSAALTAMARDWMKFLRPDGAGAALKLTDICHTAALRRAHHPYRLALTARDREGFIESLKAFVDGQPREDFVSGRASSGHRPGIAFVFSGQGPQWLGMGQELLANDPVFRAKIVECDLLMRQHAEWSLLAELQAEKESSRLQVTAIAQPAIFAIQVALAEVWRSWGIKPDVVVGHSVGEVAAAHVAGALDLEQAVRVIIHRGRCMDSPESRGRMLALGVSREEAEQLLSNGRRGDSAVAAVNGPNSVTLAGSEEFLAEIAAKVSEQGRFSSFLTVEYAFHSPRMESAASRLREALKGLRPRKEHTPIVSTVFGRPVEGDALDEEYWALSVRNPVEFAAALGNVRDLGMEVFVELSPHPVLARNIKDCLQSRANEALVVPSLIRMKPERQTLLTSLGALHVHGVQVDWRQLLPRDGQLVSLPLYPWQRERYWHESEESMGERMPVRVHPLLQRDLHSAQPSWEMRADVRVLQYLVDHRVQGYVVFPGAGYVEMALAAAQAIFGNVPCVLEEVEFLKAFILAEGDQPAKLQLAFDPQDGSFGIFSKAPTGTGWTKHVSGKMRQSEDAASQDAVARKKAPQLMIMNYREQVDIVELYAQRHESGLQFGPAFRTIAELWRKDGEALGRVRLAESIGNEGYRIHPTLLDACFQVFSAAIPSSAGAEAVEARNRLFLPVRIGQLRFHSTAGRSGWAQTRLKKQGERFIEGDANLFDEAGNVVVDVHGFRCQAIESTTRHRAGDSLEDALYEMRWEAKPLFEEVIPPPEYIPALPAIARRIQEAARERETQIGLEPDREKMIGLRMDELSRAYVLDAFSTLGWKPEIGENFSLPSLMERLAVASKYDRLMGRFLAMLERTGLIERQGDSGTWTVRRHLPLTDSAGIWREILAAAPACVPEITLLASYGEALPEILKGTKDPMQAGLGHNSFATVEHLYRDGVWFRRSNAMLREVVASVVSARPRGRRLRVLELGAGSGGLTSYVLPLLPPGEVEYTFTDVSELWLDRGRSRLQAYPFLRYQLFNIERAPDEQGMAPFAFDLVLASDVLHAATDLRATLAYVRRLLAPGGLLAFFEATQPREAQELVFGTLDEWWRFSDFDLRADSAMLPRERWEGLLTASGFAEVAAVPGLPEDGGAGYHTVLLAKEPAAKLIEPAMTVAIPASGSADRPSTTWLVFSDSETAQKLMARLRAEGDICLPVLPGSQPEISPNIPSGESYRIRPGHSGDVACLLRKTLASSGGPCGIIHLWGLSEPGRDLETAPDSFHASFARSQDLGCHTLVAITQGLENWPGARRPDLWIVTRGAQAVEPTDPPVAILQASMYGLGRVIQSERPDLSCRMADLSSGAGAVDSRELMALIRELRNRSDETEVAFRGDIRYVQRIAPASLASKRERNAAFRMEPPKGGVLDNLAFREAARSTPEAGQVEIEVSAAAMNFRDVMKGLGIYPTEADDASIFGDECSGRITRVGPEVSEFKVGDEVLALGSGCFASHVVTDVQSVFPRPPGMTPEEAATMPVCFLTAYYALHTLGRIAPGERALIHSGTGGVGLAAIQIARLFGAEVIATAGSREKRDFLRWLGVKHVLNSRSISFADEVLELTEGEGVDLVLNSLAGSAIQRGLSILRPYGRFLEIGKRDIYQNSKLGMWPLRNNLSFFAIDLGHVIGQRQQLMHALMAEVLEHYRKGNLSPLPFRAFPAWDLRGAFRHMAQARHIGKVVLAMESRHIPVEPAIPSAEPLRLFGDATYLITGGLGGLGLKVASWLASQGARHLVLVGRSGAVGEAEAEVERLRSEGVSVMVAKADVADRAALSAVLEQARTKLPPLKGVIHGAMVLDDGLLNQLTPERFQKVMAPKAIGAWNLHLLTRDQSLDFFILFSSASSVTGNLGQGNYAAANAFLDGLARYRMSLGLSALAVNWGMISEVGVVARNQGVLETLERQGLRGITPEAATTMLTRLLRTELAQAVVFPIDREKWTRVSPRAARMPRFSGFVPKGGSDSATGDAAGYPLRTRLTTARKEERNRILEEYLRQQTARVLRTASSNIDVRAPLSEAGLDSLMAVELINQAETDLNLAVPAGSLMAGRSIMQIAGDLIELLDREKPEESASPQLAVPPTPLPPAVSGGPGGSDSASRQSMEDVASLSDAEIDRLLQERTGMAPLTGSA